MEILSIGKPNPSKGPFQEGCHYNYDVGGHWLQYLYNKPTTEEIESIQKSKPLFALYIKDPVIFLLHQFGEMPWNDSPYSWWIVKPENRANPEINDTDLALLSIMMTDISTRLIVALRALTLSLPFTKRLHQEIIRQSQYPLNMMDYHRVIEETYSEYSTNDMVEQAIMLA
jgi:hypothetical protein